jgi:hypothetical protein
MTSWQFESFSQALNSAQQCICVQLRQSVDARVKESEISVHAPPAPPAPADPLAPAAD